MGDRDGMGTALELERLVAGQELEGRLLDLRAKRVEYEHAVATRNANWANDELAELVSRAILVCDAHAALVKARGAR